MTVRAGDAEPVVFEGVEVWIVALLAWLAVSSIVQVATSFVQACVRRLAPPSRVGSLGRTKRPEPPTTYGGGPTSF